MGKWRLMSCCIGSAVFLIWCISRMTLRTSCITSKKGFHKLFWLHFYANSLYVRVSITWLTWLTWIVPEMITYRILLNKQETPTCSSSQTRLFANVTNGAVFWLALLTFTVPRSDPMRRGSTIIRIVIGLLVDRTVFRLVPTQSDRVATWKLNRDMQALSRSNSVTSRNTETRPDA